MKITTALIKDRIKDSTSSDVDFELLQDIIWTFTTQPDLMAELNRRAADWRREMELNHPEK